MQQAFDAHKDEIRHLVLVDDLSLPAVQEIMRKKHGFDASISAYKTKLAEWNMFVPLPLNGDVLKHHHHIGGRKRPEKLYRISKDTPRSVPLTPPLSPPVRQHIAYSKQPNRTAPHYLSLVVHSNGTDSSPSFYQDEYVIILSELRGRLRTALKESG